MNEILNFSDLQKLTGYRSSSAIEKCLKEQGVPILYGKDSPFTLISAFKNAPGLTKESIKSNPKTALTNHDTT